MFNNFVNQTVLFRLYQRQDAVACGKVVAAKRRAGQLFARAHHPADDQRALWREQIAMFPAGLDTEALAQGGDGTEVLRAMAVAQGLTPENGYRVRLTGPVPLSDEEFTTLESGTKLSGFAAIAFVV